MSLRYPLLRMHLPMPSYIHAWILGHPRLGNALYNSVRPAAHLAGLAWDILPHHLQPAEPADDGDMDQAFGTAASWREWLQVE